MNDPIRRLFVVALLMMIALAGSTSWWTIVRADKLNQDYSALNKRGVLRGLKIQRGAIRAADGSVIARSVRTSQGIFSRRYPTAELFAHPVGYSFTTTAQSGLEAFYNERLSGKRSDAQSLIDDIRGRDSAGERLQTTLDPKAQRLATDLIARASPAKGGAAVALDPRTGAVRVMASVPSFDPNTVSSAKDFTRLNKDETRKPLIDRAVQFGYAPGSTFKVITLSAALDSGKFNVNSTVDGTNGVKISGVPLTNDFSQSFGQIDLRTALAKSVNTAYAQVAEKLGKDTMRTYMERFGFDARPKLDLPRSGMSSSGEYRNGTLLKPTSQFVDVGRMGIGQDKLVVTPLQMAQVAAAVANKGTLMKPHLGDRFVDGDGRTLDRIAPEVQSKVMSADAAAGVRDAMIAVVESGTGTQAKIPGVQVAGKTGTAETEVGKNQANKLWFIAFAPAQDPKVAIAVTVNDVVGFGGDVAAPIAKQIMQELLKGG